MLDGAPIRPLSLVVTPRDVLARAGSAVDAELRNNALDRSDIDGMLAALPRLVEELQEALEGDSAAGGLDHQGAGLDREGVELIRRLTRHVLAIAGTAAEPAIHVLRVLHRSRRPGTAHVPEDEGDLRERLQQGDAFQLLVDVAHDFRSPLTSILFLAETIREGHSGPVTDTQRSQLGLMYSAAFGLAAISSDIMDLARREQDLIDASPEAYAFSEVFGSVFRLVAPIVEEKGLELRVTFPEQTQAHGHPHALSRVLLNLATNALKFTDDGHVEMGVSVRPRGLLEFFVQDTGRGIPVDRQRELFHPFKRRLSHSLEGQFFSGSGVGLSIARRLVRGMGSELEFATSDRTGTRFWFQVDGGPLATL